MVNPLVTIIVVTYNRAHVLDRCVQSILSQTYTNIDILIVDDGSTDSTDMLLKKFEQNHKIRVIYHSKNRGVAAARNTGLNSIKGEWFTYLDSDDEMVKQAIETMINALDEVASDITAITCNCIDTTTGEFSGKGLGASGYISREDVLAKCSGEHWGLTKTSLLGASRLDERIGGGEGVLWYKINLKAKRYYLHKALRIYYTEGDDRICVRKPLNLIELARTQFYLSAEKKYIEDLKKQRIESYYRHLFYVSLYHISERKLSPAFGNIGVFVKSKNIKYAFSLSFALLFGVYFLQRITNLLFKIKGITK